MIWLLYMTQWLESYVGRRHAEAIRYKAMAAMDAVEAIRHKRRDEDILRQYETQFILDDVMEPKQNGRN